MPWPIVTAHTASCCYQQCEQSGHSVCHYFADYYDRLCAATHKALDDPNPANLAALETVFNERTPYVRD
jgi:hypothetical protein